MCIYMYVFMHGLFCHVLYVLHVYCMHVYVYIYVYVFLYVCIYMYVLGICIFVCVYIYVCSCVYIYASLCVCVGTHFCLHKSYLFNCFSCRYLGCYVLVWHCYLGSILAFSFEILNLNTTACTKSSTQVIKIKLGNMNSLFLTLIVNNY